MADGDIDSAPPRVSSSFCPTLGFSNIGVQSLTMSGIFRQEPGWEVRTVRNSRVGDHGVMFRWDPIDTIIVYNCIDCLNLGVDGPCRIWSNLNQFNREATTKVGFKVDSSTTFRKLQRRASIVWFIFQDLQTTWRANNETNMGAVSKVLLWFIQTVQA